MKSDRTQISCLSVPVDSHYPNPQSTLVQIAARQSYEKRGAGGPTRRGLGLKHTTHENSTSVRRKGALGVERYGSGNPTTGTRGPALWQRGQK